MVRLARIRKRGRSHSHFHLAQHIVKPPHPFQPVLLFLHGEVQGNAQVHLLRRFQRHTLVRVDDIPFQLQIQPRVCEQRIALRPQKGGRLLQLFAGIMLQNIGAVQPLVCQPAQLFIKGADAAPFQLSLQLQLELIVQKARRNKLPFRGLRGGELYRRLHKRPQRFLSGHACFQKTGKLAGQRRKGILRPLKRLLYPGQTFIQPRRLHCVCQLCACGAKLRTLLPVKDIAFRHSVKAVCHQHLFHFILNGLYRACAA